MKKGLSLLSARLGFRASQQVLSKTEDPNHDDKNHDPHQSKHIEDEDKLGGYSKVRLNRCEDSNGDAFKQHTNHPREAMSAAWHPRSLRVRQESGQVVEQDSHIRSLAKRQPPNPHNSSKHTRYALKGNSTLPSPSRRLASASLTAKAMLAINSGHRTSWKNQMSFT